MIQGDSLKVYLIILKSARRFFTNQMYDKESKLYYMNARYYDPQLGSFITSDPGMQGMNHYAYANSNPVRYTDPTGLTWGSDGDDSMDMSGGGESGQGGLSANGDDNSPCMPAGFLSNTNDFLGNLNDPCQSYDNNAGWAVQNFVMIENTVISLIEEGKIQKGQKEETIALLCNLTNIKSPGDKQDFVSQLVNGIVEYPDACKYFSDINAFLMKGYVPIINVTDLARYVQEKMDKSIEKGLYTLGHEDLIKDVFGLTVKLNPITSNTILEDIKFNPTVLTYDKSGFWGITTFTGTHSVSFYNDMFLDSYRGLIGTFDNIKGPNSPLSSTNYIGGHYFTW